LPFTDDGASDSDALSKLDLAIGAAKPDPFLRAAIARGVSDDFMIDGREQPDLSHFDF
jgi:hypothetical protein